MSETVKLIIEIPKEDIELIRKTSFVEDEKTMFKQSPSDRQGTMMLFRLMDSVKNGTLLDDVKAEIKQNYQEIDTVSHNEYENAVEQGKEIAYENVLSILDNIGKADMRGDKAE